MKIAMVVPNFPVISQTFILNQISGLVDLGHEVDVLSYGHGDGLTVHPIVLKYDLLSKTTYLWDPKHTWRHRFLHGDRVCWRQFFRSPSNTMASLNIFKFGRKAISMSLLYQLDYLSGRGPYDVVHCQFGTLGLQFLPLHQLKAAGGKLVVQFRGYDISQFIREKGERVYAELFKKADYFLTNCEFFKKRLISLGCHKDRIEVLYSGIDVERFAFRERVYPKDGSVKIGMIGRLVEKKGTEYVIKALAGLIKKGHRVELIIIGDGPLQKSLSDLCHNLGIDGHVYFVGSKNQAQIIEILSGVHLFAAPSIRAENGDEDAPVNVLKEAMAMGLPVVSTWHGGIPELVEDGVSGFLTPEKDVPALEQKLEWLIGHPEKWGDMGRAGRLRVEKIFDMKSVNKQLESVYQKLVDKRSAK